MNYLDLVLIGYKTTNDFPQYIYREYQKAIKENYSEKEFFNGCNSAIASFKQMFDERVNRQIEMSYKAIEVIENDKERSDEQKAIDIEKVNIHIKNIDKNSFSIPLLTLTKSMFNGNLYYSDIVAMTYAIISAQARIKIKVPENVSIEFREVYEEEVTEERKASLKAELDKIEGIPEKIKFLEIKKLDYLQDIPIRSLEVSGRVIGSGFPSGPLLFDRYIDLEIEKLKIELNSPQTIPDFQSIFNPNNNSFQVCIDLLEDLEITVNGESRLKAGKAGPLFGVIAAMRETHLFFRQDFKDMELLKFFNGHLKTDYKTFNKRGKDYESGYYDAKAFLKANFKK